MTDDPLIKRIIVALVTTILRLQRELEGEHFHPIDKNRLDKFESIESHYFSDTENVSFYRGKGLEIFDIVLVNALLETPRKLRTEQLYRTELDGTQEEIDFFKQANKKAGRGS